jgi:hypothetical protein
MDTIYEFCGNSATAKVEFLYPFLVGKSAEGIFFTPTFSQTDLTF